MAKTKMAVGYASGDEAFVSGKKLAESVISGGQSELPNIAFAFFSGKMDSDQFLKGLQSTLGSGTPVVGGSTIGIITNDYLSYEGNNAVLALIQSDSIHFKVATANKLDEGEKTAGRKLGQALGDTSQAKLLLILYDSVRVPPTEVSPPVLNASMPLLSGIEEILGSNIPILGAGLLRDYNFSPPKLFCGSHADSQSVVGVSVSGNFEPYYCIMHGCRPLDGTYYTITKIDGSILYELNGMPIVEIIDDLFGNSEWQKERPLQQLTIGVNYGAKYGKPEENKYVNRLIMGLAPRRQGVYLFEPDLEEGMEVQFMLRDTEGMVASARDNSAALVHQIQKDQKRPLFGVYIDCAGRAGGFLNVPYEEASEVQKIFEEQGIPLLGFYSGVEICPLMDKSRGLDWTGVLVVFTEDGRNA